MKSGLENKVVEVVIPVVFKAKKIESEEDFITLLRELKTQYEQISRFEKVLGPNDTVIDNFATFLEVVGDLKNPYLFRMGMDGPVSVALIGNGSIGGLEIKDGKIECNFDAIYHAITSYRILGERRERDCVWLKQRFHPSRVYCSKYAINTNYDASPEESADVYGVNEKRLTDCPFFTYDGGLTKGSRDLPRSFRDVVLSLFGIELRVEDEPVYGPPFLKTRV